MCIYVYLHIFIEINKDISANGYLSRIIHSPKTSIELTKQPTRNTSVYSFSKALKTAFRRVFVGISGVQISGLR